MFFRLYLSDQRIIFCRITVFGRVQYEPVALLCDMKILLVLADFNRKKWNSSSEQAWNIARRLTGDKHIQCVIASVRGEGEPALEEVSGVPIRRFTPAISRWSIFLGRQRQCLSSGNFQLPGLDIYLSKNAFDLVHIVGANKVAVQAASAARRKGVPYVLTLRRRDLSGADAAGKTVWDFEKHFKEYQDMLKNAALIFCGDRALRRALASALGDRKLVGWLNGVAREFFFTPGNVEFRQVFQLPQSMPLLLTVGEVAERRKQKMLLEVLSVLKKRKLNCILVVIGWAACDEIMDDFRKAVRRCELESSVLIIPGLPPGDERFRAAFHAASLVLLPAMDDVSSSAVLEAWAAGVPVVASPVGGGGMIADNVNGRVAEPGKFADWVKCCEDLLSERNRSANEKIRSAGRAEAMKLVWEKRIDELVEIYRINGILK